jgi:hypothetical protein
MPSAVFEPAIPATKRPQTYALGRTATGISNCVFRNVKQMKVELGLYECKIQNCSAMQKQVFQHSYRVSCVAQLVQCLATGWTTGHGGSIPGRGDRIFPLASVSTPARGPTQPPVQWVPGVKSGRGVTLTIQPHLVPRSRISRSYISFPPKRFVACSGTALALITIIE